MHAQSLDTRPFFFLTRAKRAAHLPAREKRGTGDEAISNGAKECAIVVNQFISLDYEDQGALLEVLDSYFCHPKSDLDSDD